MYTGLPPPPTTPRTPPIPPAPNVPNIGGLDSYGVWTGGKPKDYTWKSSENDRPITIYC
jgi:hypothetical protein